MWENPIARENVAKLSALGYRFIGPDSGWLACRNVGPGRMSEPQKIVEEISSMLAAPHSPAKNPAPSKK
jgi:phosphopantothenoylcysteine synthetase/decarboxylase